MANESEVMRIRAWLDAFINSHRTGQEPVDSAIQLKAEHTLNVRREILDIGRSLGLEAEDLGIAEILALVHDVGRFEQFARYRTFSDLRSEDHARLGARILRRAGVLEDWDAAPRSLVLFAVEQHNRANLPAEADARSLFFLKLLRDADKIDILRVATEYYRGLLRHDAIPMGLPDESAISESVVRGVLAGAVVKVEEIRTLNDFKLLQMAWVFDVHFPRSFEIIRQRRFLDHIEAALPATESVREAAAAARRHIEGPHSPRRQSSGDHS